MTRFQRAGLYSALLVLLLAALSVRIAVLPSQVEERIRAGLSDILTDPGAVELVGCSSTLARRISIERVAVRSSPARPPFLELVDVTAALEESVTPDAAAPGAPEPGPAWRIEVDRLALRVERFGGGVVADAADTVRPDVAWSLRGLLRPDFVAGSASAPRFLCEAGEFRVEARLAEQIESVPPLVIIGDRLAVRGWLGDGALEVRGEGVPEGSGPRTHGEFRLQISPDQGILEGEVRFDGLVLDDRPVSAILPASFARLDRALRPRGRVDLEVTLGASANVTGDAVPDIRTTGFRARMRSVDTTLTLPQGGVAVERASGVITLDRESVVFGRGVSSGDPVAPLRGVVEGHEARIAGEVRAGKTVIEVTLPRVETAAAARLAAFGWPARLLAGLDVAGPASATLTLAPGAGDEAWRLGMDLRGARALAVDGLRGSLSCSGSGSASGTAKLEIDEASAGLLGPVRGTAQIVSPPGGGAFEVMLAAVRVGDGEDADGRIAGRLRVERSSGAITGHVGGDDVPLRIREILSLRADRVDVELSEPRAGDPWRGRLTARLGSATLSTAGLPGADTTSPTIELARGDVEGTVSADGFALHSLRLESEGAVFRFHGSVSWSGEIDGLAVLARGEAVPALRDLAAAAPPARWKEALEGLDPEDLITIRVAGTVTRPAMLPGSLPAGE